MESMRVTMVNYSYSLPGRVNLSKLARVLTDDYGVLVILDPSRYAGPILKGEGGRLLTPGWQTVVAIMWILMLVSALYVARDVIGRAVPRERRERVVRRLHVHADARSLPRKV